MKKRKRQRASGTGCVYKRRKKDGTFSWWFKFHLNGRQVFRNANTTDQEEAKRQLALIIGEKAKGVPIAVHPLTFEEAIQNVERAAKMKNRDANYALRMHLLPFFRSATKLRAIDADAISRYIEHRQKAGVSNATINRETSGLSLVFTQAIKHGAVHAKPYIPHLPEDNVRTGFFEYEDYKRLLAAPCLKDASQVRDVISFLFITGWRLGEVLGQKKKGIWKRHPLCWRQVDFKAGTVRLDPGTTKNKEGREFVMTAGLRQLLERRWAARQALAKRKKIVAIDAKVKQQEGNDFVFTKKNGKPLSGFRKRWEKACREAKIKDRVKVLADGTVQRQRPIRHDFRRTAVRRLVEQAGVSERVAMTVSGHKTRSVFDRYHIVSPDDRREASRKLDELDAAL